MKTGQEKYSVGDYNIVYPAGHGGNFLCELLTLGSDTVPFNSELRKEQNSSTLQRLTAYASRYTQSGTWIDNEARQHIDNLHATYTLVNFLPGHISNIKLTSGKRIITADASGTKDGIEWTLKSKKVLFSQDPNRFGIHLDDYSNYQILKNSTLPYMHVDMTRFLSAEFDEEYYTEICIKLRIKACTAEAKQLHTAWHTIRVDDILNTNIADIINFEQIWHGNYLRFKEIDCTASSVTRLEHIKNWFFSKYSTVKGADWPQHDTADIYKFIDRLPANVISELQDFKILPLPTNTTDYTHLCTAHGYPMDAYYRYTLVVLNLLFIKQFNNQ